MIIVASHVAILVPSARKAAEHLKPFGFKIEAEEVWEGEGTREIYVEKDEANSLLLMERIKPGAYQRALDKRGPGLHHLAIDVVDLENYLLSLAGSGWLLHPVSVRTIKESKTAYLARPGFPALIEVQEKEHRKSRPLFVTGVSVPMEDKLTQLLSHIGLEEIVTCSGQEARFSMGGKVVTVRDLV